MSRILRCLEGTHIDAGLALADHDVEFIFQIRWRSTLGEVRESYLCLLDNLCLKFGDLVSRVTILLGLYHILERFCRVLGYALIRVVRLLHLTGDADARGFLDL